MSLISAGSFYTLTGQQSPTTTAGTLRISDAYTHSVKVLRAAVRANREAGRGHVSGERVDDVSCEIIDIVPVQAARRTLRLVAGQLRRASAGPRPRGRRTNGNGQQHIFDR